MIITLEHAKHMADNVTIYELDEIRVSMARLQCGRHNQNTDRAKEKFEKRMTRLSDAIRDRQGDQP